MDVNSTQGAESSSGAGEAGAQPPSQTPLWPSAPPSGAYEAPPAADKAGDNTAGNAGDNAAGNTADNAGDNAAGNTDGNTDVNPDDPNAWDGADGEETELPPSGLWAKMKADPEYAPEHLAIEAVNRLGPQASAWVERTRARYPGIPADTVAQIAVRRFTTFARLSGAAAGATGLPGAVIDIGVLAWTQARMVLHIAAAYGVDPADAERATDLLVLQGVHKYTQTARTALSVARGHESADKLFQRKSQPPQMSQVFMQLGWKLAQMAGVRAAKKMFAKMVPGAAIILGTWANSSATKDLAKKAVALYRKAEQHPYQLPARPNQS